MKEFQQCNEKSIIRITLFTFVYIFAWEAEAKLKVMFIFQSLNWSILSF